MSQTKTIISAKNRKYLRILLLFFALFSLLSTAEAQTKGKASYYSRKATGARQSDGTKHHHDSLTCAHRTYPMGTYLKVTNVKNGKSVIVKVTDRGPHVRGRIIDLSYRAAKEIGMLADGIAVVEVEVYEELLTPIRPPEEKYKPKEFDVGTTHDDDYHHPVWQQHDSHPKEKTEHKPVRNEVESTSSHKHLENHPKQEKHK